MAKQYISANCYCRRVFGQKVYKLALSAATSCPNRDRTVAYGGCTFCSAGGSGDFAAPAGQDIASQLAEAKRILGSKGEGLKYIAYFQSFTGTHGDLRRLEEIYTRAIAEPDIVGLSIATRPDCLGEAAMAMLTRLSGKTVLWVELGLQTMHDETARRINRGYELKEYERAIEKLRKINVHIITHLILGLPGESEEDMLESVEYAGGLTDGVKLQLLHVLKNTELEKSYAAGEFETLSMEQYCELAAKAVLRLPGNVVIHRLTGDGNKRELIAPKWSADKKRVLNQLNRAFAKYGITQIRE